jgi:hypothetical protein
MMLLCWGRIPEDPLKVAEKDPRDPLKVVGKGPGGSFHDVTMVFCTIAIKK